MLPSSGYFQTLNCPFYDSGLCDRPYCHYRHVKKDSSLPKESQSSISNLAREPGSSLIGIGDDQNILQQLVSEAVKKALQSTELSSAASGEGSSSSSPGSEVSTKLVEKVLEGLKPLVAPTHPIPPPPPPPVTTSPVPSYKPTPISELRKRHIPVPYTPKDTKTILVKRRLSSDGSSKYVKAKSTTTKHREEYVPGITGKSVSGDVPTYTPFSSQKYGTVQYSASESVIRNDLLYTPSDKSSLPSKAADYVPLGISDTCLPANLYKPTTRGISPIQEPQYQPDVSSVNISYTPSKLDSLEETDSCIKKLGNPETNSEFSVHSGDSEIENEFLQKYYFQSTIGKGDTEIEEKSQETQQCTSKELSKDLKLMNGEGSLSKSDYKDKEPQTSSTIKPSSHQKDHRSEKHKQLKDHKKSKEVKDSKEHRSSKDHKSSRNSDSQKDSRSSKEPKDEKDRKEKSHRSHKANKEHRSNCNKDEKKSKSRDNEKKEGHYKERKEKGHNEISHKSYKENKSSEEKNHSSQSHSSSSDKTKEKAKEDLKHSDKKHKSLSSSKSRNMSSKSSNQSKHGRKRKLDEQKGVIPKKRKEEDSFEQMETLLKETMDRESIDYGSFNDSDTDEELREQECLRIFNSYKPEDTIACEGNEKKMKLEEQGPSDTTSAGGKKRLAHDGAALVTRKAALPPKALVNPSQAMMSRFAKIAQEKSTLSSFIFPKPVLSTGKVRIAHVPNVSKILDAKKNLSAAVQIAKPEPTVPQSLPKGQQRVAHVPPGSVTRYPLVYPEDNSKIPTNVRQKYLNIIFEELLKKFGDAEECCKKSLYEELGCYKRSSTRNVYVNLAIITIQRLRNMDVSDISKEEPSGGSKPKVRHEDVIGGKSKAKGLWSIVPAKKATVTIDENLAYQMIMDKYILTEEELTANGYPRPHPTEKGRAVMLETIFRTKTKSKNYFERVCDRCGKEYIVNDKGVSRTDEQCVYHWGKPYKTRGIGGLETRYSCCQGEARAEGCSIWNCHISDMFDPDNQKGFVQLLEKPDATTGLIYALDCEMCYTTDGLDLLRVTVIDFEGKTVFDSLVKPEKPVLDYATRFSGISEDDMKNVTKTLLDIQATLMTMFHRKTVLIGHSLDSDLKALKLIHDTVVDTSVVFPHRRGPPFKRALKTLCAELLQKIIQSGEEGHDSAEDALACMELMKWKLKDDLKLK